MTAKETKSRKELEAAIDAAIKKVKGTKENDICKFLPVDAGGYMHHFTLRKMVKESPEELKKMISKHILDNKTPRRVPHKPRRPRGSRKKNDVIALTRTELERVLGHLRLAGDQEMAAKLSPRRSLAQLKRQLIACIRKNEADEELWRAYSEAINVSRNPSAEPTPRHVLIATVNGQ